MQKGIRHARTPFVVSSRASLQVFIKGTLEFGHARNSHSGGVAANKEEEYRSVVVQDTDQVSIVHKSEYK